MPSEQNIGGFFATLGLRNSGFTSGMLEATGITQAFGSTFAAFVANPVLGGIDLFQQAASAVRDYNLAVASAASNAERLGNIELITGIDVEKLQAIERVIKENGGSVEAFANRLTFAADRLEDARNGSAEAKAAFDKFKIDPANVTSINDLLDKIIDGFSRIDDRAKRIDAAKGIFGKLQGAEAGALLKTMDDLAGKLDKITESLKEKFVIRSRVEIENLKAIDDLKDNQERSVVARENLATSPNPTQFFGGPLYGTGYWAWIRATTGIQRWWYGLEGANSR